MPGALPLPLDDYRREHIPGAAFFSIDAISDHASPLPHMLPSAEAFAEAVGQMGISNNDHVVLYDSNAILGASRAWWMFRVFGHEKVSVLDGGLRKWKAEARPVTDKTETPLPAKFTARLVPALLRDQAAMLGNIKEPHEQIIDARAEPRFTGAMPEPRPGLKQGHIPGSRNLDHASLVDAATGMLKPKDQLLALFKKAGIDPNQKTATTCGSGVSACVLALALYALGNKDVPVYDGSWAEWGLQNSILPIETGPAR